jgi:hypothetical protein
MNAEPQAGTKLCQCGCGRPAPTAARTSARDGLVKGEPMRFLRGHHLKKPVNGAVILPSGKTVVLTLEDREGNTRHCFIDSADYALVGNRRWHATRDKKTFYALSSDSNKSRQIRMHHLIRPDLIKPDHRDGNGLNNRRSNLRPATASQNAMNRAGLSGSSSRSKGVRRANGER